MDTGLGQDQVILAVLILAVTLQMLTDGDSLLDQMIQILRDLGGKAVRFKDPKDLVAGDRLDLRNTVRVAKDHTNLSWRKTLLCILANHVDDFIGRSLKTACKRTNKVSCTMSPDLPSTTKEESDGKGGHCWQCLYHGCTVGYKKAFSVL